MVYDVKEDMGLPGYSTGLFEQVQLDPSRTCVYWNSEIDLPMTPSTNTAIRNERRLHFTAVV